jgi:hypothetical protein
MGNHCRYPWDEYGGCKDEQASFDCSSIALGNVFFAAKEICSGKNWGKIENWTESLAHYYERMTTFASRLSGPQRITHQNNRHSYRYDRDRDSHSNCSRSGKVLEQVEQIYRTATVGLDLMTLGNHVYRTPVASSDGTEK